MKENNEGPNQPSLQHAKAPLNIIGPSTIKDTFEDSFQNKIIENIAFSEKKATKATSCGIPENTIIASCIIFVASKK